MVPDLNLLRRYKESRIRAVAKALRSKNIFLYTEGTRPSVNLNDMTTIYTQPVGVRLLVVGYSDNFRYGATEQRNAVPAQVQVNFPQMHRVRVVGREEKNLSDEFVMAQAGVSGQPRYTSDRLTVPFILEPNEQIAVDLGYDTAMAAPTVIPAQSFIFFCVKVKERLTPEDERAFDDAKRYIQNHDFQRGIFLNSVSLGRNDLLFSTALAGGVANCQTRPANGPLLITGIGTTLAASQITITDSSDGHSFSLNRRMRVTALNMARGERVGGVRPVPGVPESAPIWCAYFDFPVAHLLKPGASLKCEAVNGGTDAQGIARLDTQTGSIIMFQGCTV